MHLFFEFIDDTHDKALAYRLRPETRRGVVIHLKLSLGRVLRVRRGNRLAKILRDNDLHVVGAVAQRLRRPSLAGRKVPIKARHLAVNRQGVVLDKRIAQLLADVALLAIDLRPLIEIDHHSRNLVHAAIGILQRDEEQRDVYEGNQDYGAQREQVPRLLLALVEAHKTA